VSAAVPANVSITSTASGSRSVGLQVFDTVNLSNGVNPTGTLTFNLFGPDNATCTGTPAFTSTVPVTANGAIDSAHFTTTTPGVFRWVVSYSGDTNNNPAGPTSCSDPAESVTVEKFTPFLGTAASPAVAVGGAIHDTATLNGFGPPTGTIDFRLTGPDDLFCAGPPVFTTSVTVTAGSGSYPSPPFTPTLPGTYRWQASYSGDADNLAVSMNGCLTPGESVDVTGGLTTPTISTVASAPVAVGGNVTDTATLAGGSTPTGNITFNLYGPDDATCTTTPAFTSVRAVTGNQAYTSGSFTVVAPGLYRWTASYGGDAGNNAVASGCGDVNESVVVTKANTVIATTASGEVTVGATISDTATLSGGFAHAGTITFDLFGPDNATCSGQTIFSSTVTVTGTGPYPSGPFTTVSPGTYRWVATYSGDANSNAAGPTACDDQAEAVVVADVTTTTTTSTTIPQGTTTTSTSTTIPQATTTTSTTTTIPEGTTTTSTSTTLPEGTTTTSTSTTIPQATTTTSTTIPEGTTTTSTSTTLPEGTTTTSTSTTLPEGTTTTSTTATTLPESSTTSTTTTSGSTTTTTSTLPGSTTTTTIEGAAPTAQASPAIVEAGQTTVIFGGGFPGGSPLTLTLFSDPVLLATATANALGAYQVTVTIPVSTAIGTHTVVVSSTSGTTKAQTTLTVTAPATATTATTRPGALSFTGADIRGSSALALVFLVLGLVTLTMTRRRRRLG
jgi:hypothetical protein